MKALLRSGLIATLAGSAAALIAGPAGASPVPGPSSVPGPTSVPGPSSVPGPFFGGPGQVVFVQTDNPAGNQVVAYDRSPQGTLTPAGTYSTGGLGGVLSGSVVDHLASQGSLAYDARDQALFAVNAGSNTVSVFAVRGDRLFLSQVVPSGGVFPVSVAVRGNLVYVLDAEGGGSVQGYISAFGHLIPLPGSARSLGLDPNASPQFTNTPGQVAFSPDGSKLLVTTKANGSSIDVFGVGPVGYLSPTPVVNPEPGAVPFSVAFDPFGNLLVAEAGPNSLASYSLRWNGSLTPIANVATGQGATCWVAQAGRFFYASNAMSGSVSGYQEGFGGQLSLLGSTPTDPGTVDAASSSDGRFLYVQAGAGGQVDEFQVGPTGSLTEIGSVTVPGAVGGEGIVAS